MHHKTCITEVGLSQHLLLSICTSLASKLASCELCMGVFTLQGIEPLSNNEMINQYNCTISNHLNKHALVVKVPVCQCGNRTWFDDESRMTQKVHRLVMMLRFCFLKSWFGFFYQKKPWYAVRYIFNKFWKVTEISYLRYVRYHIS